MTNEDLQNLEDQIQRLVRLSSQLQESNQHLLKKNKDFVTVLNPLLKANFLKKSKVNQIESSYLSEMGYIFKTINND